MNKSAVIIGAGIGGLAAALRLRHQGYDVCIVEQNNYAGGKMGEITQDGYRFDAGPSLFTMPHLVEELFALFDKKISNYLQYEKLDVLCQYFYPDGMHIKAFADAERLAQEVEQKTGLPGKKIERYLKSCEIIYYLVGDIFLARSFHRASTFLSKTFLKAFINWYKLDPLRTLHQANQKQLQEPHLVQLFNRYATYNGSNPYRTPATLKVIAHLEHQLGAYFPTNGMYGIAKALQQLAIDVGVEIHLNAGVQEIVKQNNEVKGINISNTFVEADLVVSNADIVPTYKMLNQKLPKAILKYERSTSALVFYWGINRQFDQLDLHNILFAENYKAEFEALFDTKSIYPDPTVYIFISSKKVPSDAPRGCENWFTMINVPENIGQDWDAFIEKSRNNIQQKINTMLDVKIENHIVSESILDPRSLEAKTSSFHGSLYGSSSNGKWAAFSRHANFSKQYNNLYFVGGSVHPGGGIPLCLNSAKIVSDMIRDSN
ncbi:MAG: phytoene desaturase [Bacteroidetes bacterium]|jgi:phytoene desaturase|nr:phytoene desaturase [Bacteroidota bacterium]